MISPKYFYDKLVSKGVNFFTGVPDSLLKDICAYITDNVSEDRHIIAANEGGAVALAAGYQMASQQVPLVYMQNSGIGNAVNPLLSLADAKVYSIPMILMVGWRGEPGVKDEPQHIKQGETTIDLFKAMGIPYLVLAEDESKIDEQLDVCLKYIEDNSSPFALIIKKGTFDSYKLSEKNNNKELLTREAAIQKTASLLSSDDIVVSTTGKISRELYEYRDGANQSHEKDFLTVGSMGHASQIALGIALKKKDRRVVCFDGDGAVLMHAGSLAIIGSTSPSNYLHVVFNNGSHDSVGGQPTVAFYVNIPDMAKACGYKNVYSVTTESEFEKAFNASKDNGPSLIEFKVHKGARKDLGRPKTQPIDNKKSFIRFLNSSKQ